MCLKRKINYVIARKLILESTSYNHNAKGVAVWLHLSIWEWVTVASGLTIIQFASSNALIFLYNIALLSFIASSFASIMMISFGKSWAKRQGIQITHLV